MKKQEQYSIDDDLKRLTEHQSDLSKTTEILLNALFRRRKTILNKRLVGAITSAETVGKIWDVYFFKIYIPWYCEYLTSIDGKGRKDVVEIAKYHIDRQDQREQRLFEHLGKR